MKKACWALHCILTLRTTDIFLWTIPGVLRWRRSFRDSKSWLQPLRWPLPTAKKYFLPTNSRIQIITEAKSHLEMTDTCTFPLATAAVGVIRVITVRIKNPCLVKSCALTSTNLPANQSIAYRPTILSKTTRKGIVKRFMHTVCAMCGGSTLTPKRIGYGLAMWAKISLKR